MHLKFILQVLFTSFVHDVEHMPFSKTTRMPIPKQSWFDATLVSEINSSDKLEGYCGKPYMFDLSFSFIF